MCRWVPPTCVKPGQFQGFNNALVIFCTVEVLQMAMPKEGRSDHICSSHRSREQAFLCSFVSLFLPLAYVTWRHTSLAEQNPSELYIPAFCFFALRNPQPLAETTVQQRMYRGEVGGPEQ